MPFTLVTPKLNTVLKYKSNKLCTILVWGKLQNSDEKNQRINGEVFHVHK